MALLAGCAQLRSEQHPLLATAAAFLPGDRGKANAAAAAKIKYATIQFTLGGRGGLLVLAQLQPGVTYWQTTEAQTVVLNRGYFASTAGLANDLEMTVLSGGDTQKSSVTPFPGNLDQVRHYRVTRLWTYGNDARSKSEQANAVFSCKPGTEKIKLPLATLPLRQCSQVLHWQSGDVTKGTFWIDPKTNRIWKAKTRPWPHAPLVEWSVARPWW